MTTRTPLHDVHAGLGASFTEFGGWQMPVRYTGDLAEHHAVRRAAGLFDLSHMAEIEVVGQEAGEALNYALVGDLEALAPGRARYTMLCTEDGGVVDDLVVYRLGTDRFLVVANAGNHDAVVAALTERSDAYQATVTDRTAEVALIAVQGPRSAAIVEALTGSPLNGLGYYASTSATVEGTEALLARTGYTGEDGFELYVPADSAVQVWQGVTQAGEPHGLQPAGLACRDTLRLEAGMPLYGHELSTARSPFEANLGRVVKFGKPGPFCGRGALERHRDASGGQVLVGLRATGRRAPRAGYAILADGQKVGEVTSGALSPTLGHPIAMAYIDRTAAATSTELAVEIRGQLLPIELTPLPFYTRTN
jgi:aminomethyltransferase